MPTSQLPIWKTLGGALGAPFSLAPASWKALAGPLLALAGASGLAFAAGYGQWGEMASAAAVLLVLAAAAWLALGFQRHLLLGAVAREPGARPWRRYGLYLLAMAIVGVVLALLSGMLLILALPAMAWFLMALNSPAPWLAAGSVVLGVLALGVGAYPPARLALVLPALAVGHDAGPARIWRLSRRNGLRLLALLVVIPGLLQGLLDLALPGGAGALPNIIPGVLLGSYLALVDVAILAFAYRALSEQALPVVSPDVGRVPCPERPGRGAVGPGGGIGSWRGRPVGRPVPGRARRDDADHQTGSASAHRVGARAQAQDPRD